MDKNWQFLINKAIEYNIKLTEKQVRQFQKYWQFLYDYNLHTNLVSSAELDIVVSKHFADSISIALLQDYLNLNSVKTFIDVGTGGGFPGIPIIITYPKLKLCAIDSTGKKTKFLSYLVGKIGVTDRVEIINSRAEEFIKESGRRENFDFCVARAVSKLNILIEYTLPFVKVGGYFVAYKAKIFQEEIEEAKNALSILGGEVVKTVGYNISNDMNSEERNLILIKKINHTPEKYPRNTGIPLKNPL